MGSAHLLAVQAGLPNLVSREGMNDAAFLARLAEAADVPLNDLAAISYNSDQRGQARFRGQTIPASLLKGSAVFRRVCPECLAKSPYHRAAWDLSFFSACPVHERLMVDACPDCGELLRWHGLDLTQCGCSGGSLSRIRPPQVAPDALDGLRLACGILGDCRFEPDVAVVRTLPPFVGLPDLAILEFVYRLGMDLTPGTRRKLFSLENPAELDEEPHLALHRGLAAARSWPDGLQWALSAVSKTSWDMASARVSRVWFDAMSAWLSGLPLGEGGELRTTLENLMKREGIGARWHR